MHSDDAPPPRFMPGPADLLAEARVNCAVRLHAKGDVDEAEAFARGERDGAWAMKHELAKLIAERGQQ